jgi:GTP cyclohydrolase I
MPPPESQLIAHDDLIVILENVLHMSRDLLKRPDETELVLKAHRKPQFAEDIVRETARAAGKKFAGIMEHETRIQIHSHSLESIHIHDVECLLDTTLADILTTLQTTEQE